MVLFALAGLLLLAACGNNAPTRTASTAATTAPTRIQPGGPIHTSSSGSGASNVVLPATFTLRPGGALSPTSVSAPASIPVDVTVISVDIHPHRLTVRIPPKPRTVTVPPRGGRVSLRYGRLPSGTYPILIDGVVQAHLVIGVQPGP